VRIWEWTIFITGSDHGNPYDQTAQIPKKSQAPMTTSQTENGVEHTGVCLNLGFLLFDFLSGRQNFLQQRRRGAEKIDRKTCLNRAISSAFSSPRLLRFKFVWLRRSCAAIWALGFIWDLDPWGLVI
jgi:hypothetical protein